MSTIGIIVLAAGESKRMGQSKQMLKIGNETLLQHAVKTACDVTKKDKIIVVLGPDTDKHQSVIRHYPVIIATNINWAGGIGTSIRYGLNQLCASSPDLAAAIIIVCDQPLLTTADLDKLITTYHAEQKDIVASVYNGVEGTPALFSKNIFDQLNDLGDNEGAKKIISQCKSKALVECENGSIDLDTPEEYANFLSSL